MRAPYRLTLAVAALGLLSYGCNRVAEPPPPPVATAPKPTAPPAPAPAPAPRSAKAVLAPLNGSSVAGEVTFTDTGNGIQIEAKLSGLAPGKHGFHIHEVGDCSGDGSAAGPHFNPHGMAHGGPDGQVLHAGDMGNVLADASGNAVLTMLSKHVTLDEGTEMGIIGRSVVVHENEDDLSSQPAGNAGKRFACGKIELVDAGAAAAAPAPAEAAPAAPAGEPAAASAAEPVKP